jgi:transcriptional regulator GlxA family with amidase domain
LGLAVQHPAVAKALRMLADDPSLSGAQIAAKLDVSLSRFARVFKADMRMSLVQYRNELRLERFDALSGAGRMNLLQAALAAGFGSYAQFHRVFRAVRGVAPREQLGRPSPAKAAARRSTVAPSRVGGRQK